MSLREALSRPDEPLRSLESAERSLKVAQAANDAEMMAFSLRIVSQLKFRLGDSKTAIKLLEQAVTAAKRLGPTFAVEWELDLAETHAASGNLSEARQLLSAALPAIIEADHRSAELSARGHCTLAMIHQLQGEHEEGVKELLVAADIARRYDLSSTAAVALLGMADAFFRSGKRLAALKAVQTAIEILRTDPRLVGSLSTALSSQGLLQFHAGRLGEAQTSFEEALTLARNTAAEWPEAHACSGLGTVYCAAGIANPAEEFLRRSVELQEHLRASISPDDSFRIAFDEIFGSAYEHLQILSISRGDFLTALDYAERSRGRALLDLLLRLRQSVNPPGAEYRFDHQEIAQFVAETKTTFVEYASVLVFDKDTLDDTNQDRLPFREVTMIYVVRTDGNVAAVCRYLDNFDNALTTSHFADPYLRVHLTFSMLIGAFPGRTRIKTALSAC